MPRPYAMSDASRLAQRTPIGKPTKAQPRHGGRGDLTRRLPLAALTILLVVACMGGPAATPTPRAPSGEPPARLTPAPNVGGDPESGRRLFLATGCAGCHSLPSLAGATGVHGPVLTNVVVRPTLAGETIPMTPDSLARWLLDPSALKPGTSMPNVGLTEPQARDITAFLYSQPYNP